MEEVLSYVWLSVAALLAGAINSLAGGGALLTFPALLAVLAPLGLAQAAVAANVTSTVALVPGSVAGAWGYYHELRQVRRWVVILAGPSLVGGTVGSLLVTRLDPRYFAFLVPWLTLGAALLFLFQPMFARRAEGGVAHKQASRRAMAGVIFFQFLVGVYGGYFGAGIGILMLGALAVMGLPDVHQMNAVKTVLGSLINGISVVVFIIGGQVYWRYAVVMALAAMVGGYYGARGARYLPRWFVRWVIIVVGFGLSAYFFYRRATNGA